MLCSIIISILVIVSFLGLKFKCSVWQRCAFLVQVDRESVSGSVVVQVFPWVPSVPLVADGQRRATIQMNRKRNMSTTHKTEIEQTDHALENTPGARNLSIEQEKRGIMKNIIVNKRSPAKSKRKDKDGYNYILKLYLYNLCMQ